MKTETLDPIELENNVAESARLLDVDHPGWHEKINVDMLNMRYDSDCIAGQLELVGENPDYNEYGISVGLIAFSYKRAFYIPSNYTLKNYTQKESYDFLTELWKDEIAKRNAEDN